MRALVRVWRGRDAAELRSNDVAVAAHHPCARTERVRVFLEIYLVERIACASWTLLEGTR